VLAQPYRLDPGLECVVHLPDDPRGLLPGSSAPAVLRLRQDAAAGRDGGGGT
jgi:hypothetical protein